MKIIISISVFILGICNVAAQISAATEKFALPVGLNESSGVIYFNNKLITHNDSGGNNELYEVDLVSGLVTRTITISNATNVDWEDMTQDDTNIYIGDIGNNVSGNRKDLKIYKISKSDYLSMETITAETISYSYSDQIDFNPSGSNNTEWDAEALVSLDAATLIIFSKNWVNGITKGYLVSKIPGMYSLIPLETPLNSLGLITGGTYNTSTAKLFLVGYTSTLSPFVWESEDFAGSDVFSGTNTRTSLPASFGLEQIEAITFVDETNYLITAEEFTFSIFSDYAKVIEFTTNDEALSLEKDKPNNAVVLSPNPVNDFLHIKSSEIVSIELYDMKQVKLYEGNNFMVNMSSLSSGIYFVNILFSDHSLVIKKIIKK